MPKTETKKAKTKAKATKPPSRKKEKARVDTTNEKILRLHKSFQEAQERRTMKMLDRDARIEELRKGEEAKEEWMLRGLPPATEGP